MIRVLKFIVGPLDTNTYLLYDEESRHAVLIDPGFDIDEFSEVLKWIERLRLEVDYAIATHGHFDHVYGVDLVKSVLGSKFIMHVADLEIAQRSMEWVRIWQMEPVEVPTPDIAIERDTTVAVPGIDLELLHTPGHTPGSIVVYVPSERMLFSGDTLFCGTVGRTDLPGGNERLLMQSLARIFRELPEDTIVYPGHGPSTSLKRERRANIFVEEALRLYGADKERADG